MTARTPEDAGEPTTDAGLPRDADARLGANEGTTTDATPDPTMDANALPSVAPIDGPPAEQNPEPYPEPADWRELLEQRRFGAARRAFLAAQIAAAKAGEAGQASAAGAPLPTEDADTAATRLALSALADVEELVRERSFAKAQERIRRLEEPAAIAPWDDLVADLERLRASAKALDQRDPDAAVATLGELGSTWFPAEVYTQLGTASIYDDRLDEARAHFEAALQLDPQHYRALTNLGNVALEEGRVDDAIDSYERALKFNESFPNAHHNLGVAYRRKGQLHRSVRSLRKAQRAQQRQEATEARESLGRIGAGSGAKIIRWVVYAVVAVALYLLLKNRGLF